VHRLGLLLALVLAVGACSSSGGRSASRPAAAPPTSPAPTTSTSPSPTTAARGSTTTFAPNLSAVRLALRPVASGLASPVDLAWRAHDARIYVAEQGGRIRIIGTNGRPASTPVLSLSVSHGNEQGLLGLVFSPDGTKLYVDYTDPKGDSHVDEYTMRGDVADTSTRREILFQQQPFPNHNGGEVTIGPDGMLYIGFGDGGGGGDPFGNAQSLRTWLGKILRVDPKASGSQPYAVPADNPFVSRARARTEIWMYGLRNPWRFSFDRANGDVWIGDVGQNLYEEIDYAKAGDSGINWGWNAREGLHQYKRVTALGARDPIIETSHADGNCAIVGGYVYRGTAIPLLRGTYLYGDNCNPALVGARVQNGRVLQTRDLGQVEQLTSFGEGPSGELYAASRAGTIYRLTAG
jgi:glucose/arabinose dehydrogenase